MGNFQWFMLGMAAGACVMWAYFGMFGLIKTRDQYYHDYPHHCPHKGVAKGEMCPDCDRYT